MSCGLANLWGTGRSTEVVQKPVIEAQLTGVSLDLEGPGIQNESLVRDSGTSVVIRAREVPRSWARSCNIRCQMKLHSSQGGDGDDNSPSREKRRSVASSPREWLIAQAAQQEKCPWSWGPRGSRLGTGRFSPNHRRGKSFRLKKRVRVAVGRGGVPKIVSLEAYFAGVRIRTSLLNDQRHLRSANGQVRSPVGR